jgi:hypothetical protein
MSLSRSVPHSTEPNSWKRSCAQNSGWTATSISSRVNKDGCDDSEVESSCIPIAVEARVPFVPFEWTAPFWLRKGFGCASGAMTRTASGRS